MWPATWPPSPASRGADERLLVDREVDRLAHVDVVERRHREVEVDVADGVAHRARTAACAAPDRRRSARFAPGSARTGRRPRPAGRRRPWRRPSPACPRTRRRCGRRTPCGSGRSATTGCGRARGASRARSPTARASGDGGFEKSKLPEPSIMYGPVDTGTRSNFFPLTSAPGGIGDVNGSANRSARSPTGSARWTTSVRSSGVSSPEIVVAFRFWKSSAPSITSALSGVVLRTEA